MWTPAYPDRHRLFPSTWVGSAAFTAIQQETAEWGKKWLATKISLTRKPARIPFVPSPVLFSGGNLNRYSAGRARAKWPLGSGPRYMICVTLFCTLRESGYRQNSHLLTVVSLVMLVNIWKCVQFHHLLAHGMNNRGLVIQGSIGCPAHLQEWRRKQDE